MSGEPGSPVLQVRKDVHTEVGGLDITVHNFVAMEIGKAGQDIFDVKSCGELWGSGGQTCVRPVGGETVEEVTTAAEFHDQRD